MNELHLFAGAGGGILGGILLGHTCLCAVEIDKFCRKVLLQRQRDGILPRFPIWDDVKTFDGNPWAGKVDIVCGGFPCQDISCAGKGDGLDGERSGLWTEFARIVGEVRPRYAFVENSPMLTLRGGDRVLADLAALGFSAKWGIISAGHVGAPHRRDRIWIVAYANGGRREIERKPEHGEFKSSFWDKSDGLGFARCGKGPANWWKIEPELGRVANGITNRVDKLRCLGNGQVPGVAALAWRILSGH